MHAFTQYAGQKLSSFLSTKTRFSKRLMEISFFTIEDICLKKVLFFPRYSLWFFCALLLLYSHCFGALFRPSLSLSDVLEWSAERERGKMALGGIWSCCVLCLFWRLFALVFALPMTRFACEKTVSRLLCFCTNSIINADGDRDATFIIHFYISRAQIVGEPERDVAF